MYQSYSPVRDAVMRQPDVDTSTFIGWAAVTKSVSRTEPLLLNGLDVRDKFMSSVRSILKARDLGDEVSKYQCSKASVIIP